MTKLKTPEEYITTLVNKQAGFFDSTKHIKATSKINLHELIKQVQRDTLDFAAENAEVMCCGDTDSCGFEIDKDSILKHKP